MARTVEDRWCCEGHTPNSTLISYFRAPPMGASMGAMKAALFNGPRDITVGERADPDIQAPTDAIVHVTLACVCGSDLWYYRGLSPHDLGAIGHEFIGTVAEVGSEVRDLRPGDFVVAP